MNLTLPFERHALAFRIIALMVVLAATTFVITRIGELFGLARHRG
ncbi:hypothetical protein [Methanoculleus sp.]|nr:hypothetical protein [Methanoculleus sp.]